MAHRYEEKRNFVRVPIDCDVLLRSETDNREFTVRGKDLSAGGVLFYTDQEMSCGEHFNLHIEAHQALFSVLDADIEVVRIVPLNEGGYAIGSAIHSIAST